MDDARTPVELAGRFSALGIDLPALTWHAELAVGAPVADFASRPQDALDWWRRLRAVADRTGYQPVLVDPDRTAPLGAPMPEELSWVPLSAADRLAECAALDPVAVLNPGGSTLDTVDPDEVERWLDEWPDEPRRFDRVRVPTGCAATGCAPGEQEEAAVVALVPAAHGWQVPVLLSFGDFNDCPRPSVHGAVLRHWHQRYGLDLVAIASDGMQFVVSRPPRTRREALEFAWEYAGYCPDGFDGLYAAEDLGGMAACLIDAETVLTWWD
jgi:hypothetical protein